MITKIQLFRFKLRDAFFSDDITRVTKDTQKMVVMGTGLYIYLSISIEFRDATIQ